MRILWSGGDHFNSYNSICSYSHAYVTSHTRFITYMAIYMAAIMAKDRAVALHVRQVTAGLGLLFCRCDWVWKYGVAAMFVTAFTGDDDVAADYGRTGSKSEKVNHRSYRPTKQLPHQAIQNHASHAYTDNH